MNPTALRSVRIGAFGAGLLLGTLAAILLIPPARDRFFTTKLWPWRLPWDTNEDELAYLKSICVPGDIIVESNMHGPQWIALCTLTTGTTWVHAALVGNDKSLITVEKSAIETDFSIYLNWGSTRLAIIRPPYVDEAQAQRAIEYATSKLGTAYDASFRDPAGNCNGLVGSALLHSGIQIKTKRVFGKKIFAPDAFFQIPHARVIWLSDRDRKHRTRTNSQYKLWRDTKELGF